MLASFTIQNVFARPSQETWELFTDPENEFSLEYPSSWQLIPAENRFDRTDVNMINSEALSVILECRDGEKNV